MTQRYMLAAQVIILYAIPLATMILYKIHTSASSSCLSNSWPVLQLGLLSATEAEECIAMEFNPVRVGFHGGDDVWTRDVLNLGVKPDTLIQKVHVVASWLCRLLTSVQHMSPVVVLL